jgi:hypothetical protein
MVAEVYAGIAAFKTMFDQAKSLMDIHDANTRNMAIIGLQQQILSAQAEESALLERVRALENENVELKKWDAEKRRYQLEMLPPGVYVYGLRPENAAGEPLHSICQTCYQRGKKSVLHASEPSNGIYHLQCHECGTRLRGGAFSGDGFGQGLAQRTSPILDGRLAATGDMHAAASRRLRDIDDQPQAERGEGRFDVLHPRRVAQVEDAVDLR